MLRIMVVDENPQRSAQFKKVVEDFGCKVVGLLENTFDLAQQVATTQPDVIVIGTDSLGRDTLDHICHVSQDTPKPIVMFTHDGDSEKIRTATRAGVSAYIVGHIDLERLKPIIDVAIERFKTFQELRNQLENAQTKLAERKIIDRAKGILMKQRQINEDEAYKLLRSFAMNQGKKVAVIASQVIEVSKYLL